MVVEEDWDWAAANCYVCPSKSLTFSTDGRIDTQIQSLAMFSIPKVLTGGIVAVNLGSGSGFPTFLILGDSRKQFGRGPLGKVHGWHSVLGLGECLWAAARGLDLNNQADFFLTFGSRSDFPRTFLSCIPRSHP